MFLCSNLDLKKRKLITMKTVKEIIFICTFMTFVTVWYSSRFESNYTELQEKTIWKQTTTTMRPATMNPQPKMRYILQWTNPYREPFIFMETGQKTFIRRRCFFDNCFITSNRHQLDNLKEFDAVLFHAPELSVTFIRRPIKRSLWQKYVFVSLESSANYPMYDNSYDGFFNWTWTYKLNSDIYYRYFIIKNMKGDIIGPKKVMHWLKLKEMKPIEDEIKKKLKSKRVAAAWFVSNCRTPNKRAAVAKLLQHELAKYKMRIDIYGLCGDKDCPQIKMKTCLRKLETYYYFYLSFENTHDDDYVTEKLLHALQHYTVPIVYGGANYTRFMPEGTYLKVQNQSVQALVKQMVEIINDKQKYYDYFRWKNHYSYHFAEEFPESDSYCDFCKKINDFELENALSEEAPLGTFSV